MKYIYQYKSADNIQHSGKVHASSRERAFDKIKARGLKPYRLELAPGIGNKILIHLMKWGAVESAIVAAIAIMLVSGVRLRRNDELRITNDELGIGIYETRPRAQIAGIPEDYNLRLKEIFSYSAERFLALHAMPGIVFEEKSENLADLEEAIDSNNLPREEDEEWVKALKQIVAGMKEEAFILLKSGKTPGDIEIWLDGRQNRESAYRQQIIESDIPEAQKRKTLKALGL